MIDHKIKKLKLDSHEDCRVNAAPMSPRDETLRYEEPSHLPFKKDKKKKQQKNASSHSSHYKREQQRAHLLPSPLTTAMPFGNQFSHFSFSRTISPQMTLPPMSPVAPLSPHLNRMILAGHSPFLLNPFSLAIAHFKLPRFHFGRLPFFNSFHSNALWTTFF